MMLEKVAAVEREIRHLLFRDDVTDRRRLSVDGRGVGRHFDSFGDVAGLELDVHTLELVHIELDVREHRELEARLLRCQDVRTNRQQGHDKRAVVACGHLASEPGLLVRDDNFGLRHDGAGCVLHRPENLAGGGLGACSTCQQEHGRDRSDDPIRCSHH
jgi:hypothetical protein